MIFEISIVVISRYRNIKLRYIEVYLSILHKKFMLILMYCYVQFRDIYGYHFEISIDMVSIYRIKSRYIDIKFHKPKKLHTNFEISI